MSRDNRQYVLAVVLIGLLAAATFLLRAVIGTAFFAVTVAYVLFPVREYLRDRGFSRRWAAVAMAVSAVSVVLSAFTLAAFTLYRRREAVLALLTEFPSEVTIRLGEFSHTIERASLVEPLGSLLRDVAVNTASAAPVLALKLLLFSLIVYGLLLRPREVSRAIYNVVPDEYHGVVNGFHIRTRDTLYGIYILQAATAAGTFIIALVTFLALGYPAPVTLALIAGILQFIPVLGPGVLLGLLMAVDIVSGNIQRAILVAVVGGVVVGLIPDMLIRPRLATYAAHLPVTLYFVGFVGGILSLGVIGFIAGPLIVALVVETVSLLSRGGGRQTTL